MKEKTKFKAIVAELSAAGISYNEISNKLGITPLCFRNKLKGKTEWKLSEIIGLMNILNCNFDYLFKQDS